MNHTATAAAAAASYEAGPARAPRTPVRRALRIAFGGLAALLVTIAATAAAFLGTALLVPVPTATTLAAAAVLLGVAVATARWPLRPGRARLAWAAAVSAAVTAASWPLFQPLAPATAQAAADGSAHEHWTLPTGSRIAYRRFAAEPGAAPRATPVVYLHGGPAVPARQTIVESLQPLRAAGYDLVVYDQVGSGASGRLDDIAGYTLERNVADLEAIREQLGAQQLVLVGSSWGAVLATHYLAAHPERVQRMVLLAPGVLTRRTDFPYDHRRSASAEDDRVLLPPPRMVLAGVLARISPPAAERFASQDEMGAEMDRFIASGALEAQGRCAGSPAPAATAGRAAGANYYANLMIKRSLERAPDPRERLREVHTPVLILRGECDYIPLASAQLYRDALPAARLAEVPGAGHALTAGAAGEAVAAAMRTFLEEPAPAPAMR
ncbi:MAG: alpha/beta hydrolase [Rubrivivax sp.]|nr:alpha/beta hydrolase [Rubrivivax sp.]